MTRGTGERSQAAACGTEQRWAPTMKRPTPPKYVSACAQAKLLLYARAPAAAKLRLRPRDKRMSLRSKVPKPMQPSELLHLVIHLALHCTTVNRWVSASSEV